MKINLNYPGNLFDPPDPETLLVKKMVAAILFVAVCAYCIYPWLHRLIGVPARIEIALTGVVASILVLIGARYILRVGYPFNASGP